jgi:hypothetical protein
LAFNQGSGTSLPLAGVGAIMAEPASVRTATLSGPWVSWKKETFASEIFAPIGILTEARSIAPFSWPSTQLAIVGEFAYYQRSNAQQ